MAGQRAALEAAIHQYRHVGVAAAGEYGGIVIVRCARVVAKARAALQFSEEAPQHIAAQAGLAARLLQSNARMDLRQPARRFHEQRLPVAPALLGQRFMGLIGKIRLHPAQIIDAALIANIGPHAKPAVLMEHARPAQRGSGQDVPRHAAQSVIGHEKVVAPQMRRFNVVFHLGQLALIAEAGDAELVFSVRPDNAVSHAGAAALRLAFNHQLAALIAQAVYHHRGMIARMAHILGQHIKRLLDRLHLVEIRNQTKLRVQKYAHLVGNRHFLFRREMRVIAREVKPVILHRLKALPNELFIRPGRNLNRNKFLARARHKQRPPVQQNPSVLRSQRSQAGAQHCHVAVAAELHFNQSGIVIVPARHGRRVQSRKEGAALSRRERNLRPTFGILDADAYRPLKGAVAVIGRRAERAPFGQTEIGQPHSACQRERNAPINARPPAHKGRAAVQRAIFLRHRHGHAVFPLMHPLSHIRLPRADNVRMAARISAIDKEMAGRIDAVESQIGVPVHKGQEELRLRKPCADIAGLLPLCGRVGRRQRLYLLNAARNRNRHIRIERPFRPLLSHAHIFRINFGLP